MNNYPPLSDNKVESVVLASDYYKLLEVAKLLREVAIRLWNNEDDTGYYDALCDSAWIVNQ